MNLNWQRALQVGLTGVGERMNKNYDDYQAEQRQIAMEDRTFQMSLRKEQELGRIRSRQEAAARKVQADAMRASGGYAPEEIAAAEGGIPVSTEFAGQQKIQQGLDARAAEIRQRLGEDATDAEVQNELQRLQELGETTVGERNQAAAMAIVEGLEVDEQGNPKISKSDALKLAVLGVKVPQREPMSDTVAKDVWKTAMSTAREEYSKDNFTDDQVINEANTLLQRAGSERKVKDAVEARRLLIRNATKGYYIRGVSMVTGTIPAAMPDGSPIDPNAANAAIGDGVDTGTTDAPEEQGAMEGPGEPTIMGTPIFGGTKPTIPSPSYEGTPAGEWEARQNQPPAAEEIPPYQTAPRGPQPQGLAGPGGATTTDDIIKRMRQR